VLGSIDWPHIQALLQVGSGVDANMLPTFPDDARNGTEASAHPAFAFADPSAELRGRQQIIEVDVLEIRNVIRRFFFLFVSLHLLLHP
jgi:hypothetical protein